MSRIERLQTQLKERDWDALLVHRPDEIRYLTGARGTLVRLLVTPTRAIHISHFIDLEQTRLESPAYPRIQANGLDGCSELLALLAEWDIKRLALSQDRVSHVYYHTLAKNLAAAGVELIEDQQIVRNMRLIKDQEEIELIRKATQINDEAYHHLLPLIKPGVTERELAIETRHFMWQAGVEDIRFLVVQSGPHSALPHIYPTDRVIQQGDLVLMDWVPLYKGYASDVTRTVVVGEPSDKQREVYELVRKAQAAGLAAAQAGKTGHQADAAAREIIAAGGYGEYFGHSLGHGINEGPNLDVNSEDILRPGMVCTVEPGIYIAGWGGVRIEDTVLIQESGPQALPTTTKELVIL